MTEMPSLTSTAYATSTVSAADFLGAQNATFPTGSASAQTGMRDLAGEALKAWIMPARVVQQPKEKQVPSARIVKIFIADPNENLPLDKRILYSGDEKLTDLTDQELFFEVPIKELLDAHNAVRAATRDRKQTEKFGREVFLEPVRIRDLKMVVTTVAEF